ncbi:hypothetical protein N7490_011511 [Penicillium lividum]|nr:hypothetical protein N7490_011511 [Penicillium lividum]
MNGQYQRGDDISNFPIEEARFVGIYTLVMLSALGTAGFGISLMKRTGYSSSDLKQLCGTLLTDLNPNASATVQASYNLVRCLGTAAAIASQQPLANAIGLGWCFSFFAFIMLSAAPLAMILTKWGPDWRRINLVNTTNDIP